MPLWQTRQGSPGSGRAGWLLGGETLPRASAIIYPKSAASRHVAPDRELQYFISLPVNQPCVGADGNIVWSLSDTLIICSPLIDTFTQQSTLHQRAQQSSLCVCSCERLYGDSVRAWRKMCLCVSGGLRYCQWPEEGWISLLWKQRVISSLETNDRITGSRNDHRMKGGAEEGRWRHQSKKNTPNREQQNRLFLR